MGNYRGRINWIDAAKAIGILAIFLGHIPNESGVSCSGFVWMFHVPLFFFLAGCTEALAGEKKFVDNLLKKVKGLLIPWLLFASLSLVVCVLEGKAFSTDVQYFLGVLIRGTIRNKYFAGSLWFLTGLVVLQIIFSVLRKVRSALLILLIAAVTHYCSKSALSAPAGLYNYDSAMAYMIYYAIGYVLFPHLRRILEGNSKSERWCFVGIGSFSVIYLVYSYYSKDILAKYTSLPYVGCFIVVLRTVILILAIIAIAKIFENVAFLGKIGSNTLYLCGSEYMVTSLVTSVLELLGMSVVVKNQFMGIIYAAVLICVASVSLIPAEKYMLGKLYRLTAYLQGENKKCNQK